MVMFGDFVIIEALRPFMVKFKALTWLTSWQSPLLFLRFRGLSIFRRLFLLYKFRRSPSSVGGNSTSSLECSLVTFANDDSDVGSLLLESAPCTEIGLRVMLSVDEE